MTTFLKKSLSVLMAFLVFVGGLFVSFNIDKISADDDTYNAVYDYTNTTLSDKAVSSVLADLGMYATSDSTAAALKIKEFGTAAGINPSYSTLNTNAWGTLTNPYVIYEVNPGTKFEATFFLASNTGTIYCKEKIAEKTEEPFEFVIEASASATEGWKNAVDTSSQTTSDVVIEYNVPDDCKYVKITFPNKGYVEVSGVHMATQDRAKLMGVKYFKYVEPVIEYDSTFDYTALGAMGVAGNEATLGVYAVSTENVAGLANTANGFEANFQTLKNNAWGTLNNPYVVYEVNPGSKFEASFQLNTGAEGNWSGWTKQTIAHLTGEPFEFKIEASADGITWKAAWDTSAETEKNIVKEYNVPDDCKYVRISFPQKGNVNAYCSACNAWHLRANEEQFNTYGLAANDFARLKGVRYFKYVEPVPQYDSTFDYTALGAMGVAGNEATLGVYAVSTENVAGLANTANGIEANYATLKNNAWGTLNNPYVIYEVKPGTKFEASFQLNTGADGNWNGWTKQTIAHLTGEPFEFKIEASADGVTWKNAWDTSAETEKDIVKEYNVPDDCKYVRISFPQKGNVNAYCSACNAWHLRPNEEQFNAYGLVANDFARLKGVKYFKAEEQVKTYDSTYDYAYVDGNPTNVAIKDANKTDNGIYAISGSGASSLVKNSASANKPGRNGIELDYNRLNSNKWGTLENAYVIYKVTPGTYFEATLYVASNSGNSYCKQAISAVTEEPFEMKIEASNKADSGWKGAVDTSSYTTSDIVIEYFVPEDCNYVKITYPQTGYIENVNGVAKIQANDLARIMKVRYTKAVESEYDTVYDYTDTDTFDTAAISESNVADYGMVAAGTGLYIWEDKAQGRWKGINPTLTTINSNAWGTFETYVIYNVKPGTKFEATLYLASNSGNSWCKQNIATAAGAPFEFKIESSNAVDGTWGNAWDTSGETNKDIVATYEVPADCNYVKITFPQKGYVEHVMPNDVKIQGNDLGRLYGVKFTAGEADPGPGTNPDPGPGTNPDPGPGTNPDPGPGTNPDPGPTPTFNTTYDYTTFEAESKITDTTKYGIYSLSNIGAANLCVEGAGKGINPNYATLNTNAYGTLSKPYMIYKVQPGSDFQATFFLASNTGTIYCKEKIAEKTGEPFEFVIEAAASSVGEWKNAVDTSSYSTSNVVVNYTVPADCEYVKITFPQAGYVEIQGVHMATQDRAKLMGVKFNAPVNQFENCDTVMNYEANGPVNFFYDNDDYLIYLYHKNGIAIKPWSNTAVYVAPDADYVKGTGFDKPYVTFAVKPNTKFVAEVVVNREAAATLGADFKVKVYESTDSVNWVENFTAPTSIGSTDYFKFTTAADTKFVKVEFPHTDAVKDVDKVNEIFGLSKVGLTPDTDAYKIDNPYGDYNFVDTSKFYNDPRYVSFNAKEFGVHAVTGPGGFAFEGANDKPGYYLAYSYQALLNRENTEKNGLVYAVKPGSAFQVVALVGRAGKDDKAKIQVIEAALGTNWDIMLEVSYDGENWTPYNNPSRILTDKHLMEGTPGRYLTEVITIPALPADANFVRVLYPHTGNMNKVTGGKFEYVGNDLIGVAQVNYTYAKANLPPKYNTMYDYSDTSIGTQKPVTGAMISQLGLTRIGGLGLMYIEDASRPGICVGYGSLNHEWGTKEKAYVVYEVTPGTVFEAQFRLASGGGAFGWNKETIANLTGEPFEFVIEASDSETSGWKNAVDTSSFVGSSVTIKYQVPSDCTFVKITFPQNGKFKHDMNGDGTPEEIRGNDLARLMSVGFTAPENQFAGCDTVFDYKANGPVDFFYDNDGYLIYLYEKNGIAVENFTNGTTYVAPDKDYVKGTGFSKPYVTFAVKPVTEFVAGVFVDREAAALRGAAFKVKIYESADGTNWKEKAVTPISVASTDYFKLTTAATTKFVKVEFPHTDAVKGVENVNEIFGLAKVGFTPNDSAYVIENPYGDYEFESTYDFCGDPRPGSFNADKLGIFEIGVPGALSFEGDPAKPGYYLAYTYGNLVGKESVEKASLTYSVKPGTAFQVVALVSRDDGFIQKIEAALGTNWDIMLEVSADGNTWSSYKPSRILTEEHLMEGTPKRYVTEVITIPSVPSNVNFVKIIYPHTGAMNLVTGGAFEYVGNDLIGINQVSLTDGGAVPPSKYKPDKSFYNSVMDATEGAPDESIAYITGLQYAEGMQVMAPSWTYLNGTGGAVMANAGIYAIVKEGSAFYAEAAFRSSLLLCKLDENGEVVKNEDGNAIIVKSVDPFKYIEGYGARLYFSSDRMTWDDVTDQYLQVINGSGALSVLHRFDIKALPAGVKYVKVELPINRNMIGCPVGNEGLATAYTGNDFCGIRRIYFNADEHVEYKAEINYGNYFTEEYGSGFPKNITGENNKVLGLYSYTPGAFEIKDYTSSSTPDGRITIKESYLFNKEEVDAPYLVYNVEENSPFYMGVNVSGTGRLSAMPDGRLRIYVSETGQDGSWTEFTNYTYVENQAHTFSRYFADNLGAKTKFLMIVFPITGDLSLNPENNAKGSSGANFFQIRDLFANIVDFDPTWDNKKEYVFIHPNSQQQVIIPGEVIVTPFNWLFVIIPAAAVLVLAAAAVVVILIIKKKKKNAKPQA